MSNDELNDISTQNIKTKEIMPDNLVRSDELDVGENNYDHGPSLHAIAKRTKKITRITLVTVSIVAGGALIGFSIASTVLGSVPTITNISSEVKDNHAFISFKEENKGRGKMYLTLYNIDTLLNKLDGVAYQGEYSQTGEYLVELELEYSKAYQVQFIASNDFDYNQPIENTSFNIVIPSK